jgi:hypothetical protein
MEKKNMKKPRVSLDQVATSSHLVTMNKVVCYIFVSELVF